MPPREPTATLRPFRLEDYPALHALLRRIDPGFSSGVDDLRRFDEQRRDEPHGRAVLERGDALVAAIEYRIDHAERRDFDLRVVLPVEEADRFAELYGAAMAMVAQERPRALKTYLREDWGWLLTEFERRGFREHERHTLSRLDLREVEPALAATGAERLAALGLRLVSYADADPDDEASQRRLYDLDIDVIQDIPWAEPLDLWDFDTWRRRTFAPPVLTEGILLAETERGDWVGLTMLMRSDLPGQLQTGLTGVLASWRGRGVASALKLAAIDFARKAGADEIVTRNHAHNRGMLGINERLGFRPDPAWLTLRLDLIPGDDA